MGRVNKNQSGNSPKQPNFSRRNFLKIGALTAGTLAFDYDYSLSPLVLSAECILERTVVRANDLLCLTFRFVNFMCIDGPVPKIQRQSNTSPAFIVVEFPPQHLAEEVIEGSSLADGRYPDRRILDARLSNPTILSFRVNSDEEFPYTLEGLLGRITSLTLETVKPLKADNLNVQNEASQFNEYYARYFQSGLQITQIELPYRMVLAPDGEATVCHDTAPRPVGQSDWVPLWHTFVVNKNAEVERCGKQSKAITLLPLATRGICSPFSEPLSPTGDGKRQVVGLAHATGQRVEAERLMLSSIGGSLVSKFNVPRTEVKKLAERGYDLTAWEQQTSWGRDQFVREVHAGYLYPYGHRVSYEIITKRVVRPISGASASDTVAFLEREHFITAVKEDVEMDKPGQSPAGNQIAFTEILLKDKKSPPLDNPTRPANVVLDSGVPLPPDPVRDSSCLNSPHGVPTEVPRAFWVREALTLNPVTMNAFANDHAGGAPDVPAPLIFVSIRVTSKTDYDKIAEIYKEANHVDMKSQRVAFTPSPANPTTTTVKHETNILATSSLRFTTLTRLAAFSNNDLVRDEELKLDRAPFQPIIEAAEVKLDSINKMFGQENLTAISYAQPYIDHAFSDANKGCVFAKVTPGQVCKPGIDFTKLGDKALGLVTPNMDIVGLSALTGPISADLKSLAEAGRDALKDFSIGDIKLDSMFGDAKIFGEIPIKSILKGLEKVLPNPNVIDGSLPKVPALVTRIEGGPKNGTIVTEFSWETTKLQSGSAFEPEPGAVLSIKATTRTPFSAQGGLSRPTVTVESELKNFKLNLIPGFKMITLDFSSIKFRTESGKSPKVEPHIRSIKFDDVLEFVQKIAAATSTGKARNLPKIEIGPGLIAARFLFPIPDLTMGAFTLMNLRVGVGLKIPLDQGRLVLSIQLGERMNPFTIAVGIFGGGGFFRVAVSANGLEELEMALEFGAMAALSFGSLATGKAEIKGGIYYYKAEDKCKLAAYLRAAGSVNVLGLITVSIIYYLELSYQSDGSLWGKASVTVEIELLFFSKSVTLTLERRLAGSGSNARLNDPGRLVASLDPLPFMADERPLLFSELMPEPTWVEYTEAFGG